MFFLKKICEILGKMQRNTQGDENPTAQQIRRARWLRRILFWVPSFSSRGLLIRLCISMLLLGGIWLMLSVKFDKTIPLIMAALQYNPVVKAQELYDQKRLVASADFIEFYQSIPSISENKELTTLKAQIEKDRSSWSYRGQEVWKGLSGDGSEEVYGKAVEIISEFTSVGDTRALYGEYQKYSRGEEVDSLNVGLAGLGLGLTAASLGPQMAASVPLKKTVNFFKKSSELMSPGLKKSINGIFEPLVHRTGDIKQGIKQMRFSDDLVRLFKSSTARFADIMQLATREPKAAMLVVKYSDNVDDLARNAKVALSLGGDAGRILAHGGEKALDTAIVLERKGALSGTILKKTMQFGEAGLEWVKKMPLESLINKVRAVRVTLSGKAWLYLCGAIGLIPLPVLLAMCGYMGLTLYKMWRLRPEQMKVA